MLSYKQSKRPLPPQTNRHRIPVVDGTADPVVAAADPVAAAADAVADAVEAVRQVAEDKEE